MIDFTKALDSPPKTAKPKQTPKNTKTPTKQQLSTTQPAPSLDNNNNIYNKADDSNIDCRSLPPEIIRFHAKGPLSEPEATFIFCYLSGEHDIKSAMLAAGYGRYGEKYRYLLGKKILKKYELSAGGVPEIMRDMGYGEVEVLKMLVQAATEFRSETVKLNARIALAKALGMQDTAQVSPLMGVQIVIKSDKLGSEDHPAPEITVDAAPAALPAPGTPGVRIIK